jgi:hypothetical protein
MLKSLEALDIYDPRNGPTHFNLDGGGDKGSYGSRVGRQDIDILLATLASLVDQAQNSFHVLVVGPNQQRYVPLPKEAPR